MIDHGAPQISLAQAEFEQAAREWQDRAAAAFASAARYTALASALGEAYRDAIARSIEEAERRS